MAHEHERIASTDRRRLAVVFGLTATFMVVEAVGGYISNSLTLLADAGHMLTDVGALGLNLFAIWFAERKPPPKLTYGLYRVEVLFALLNGVILVAVAGFVFYEAYERIGEPPEVQGGILLAVAILGLLVNLAGFYLLRKATSESINISAALLSVSLDTLGSVGAIVGGLIVVTTGINLADPIISVVIGILILYTAKGLVTQTLHILLEGTPIRLAYEDVRNEIRAVPGVLEVRDLHLWTITSGLDALSAHIVVDPDKAHCNVRQAVGRMVRDKFEINHTTIQVDLPGEEESTGF